MNTKNKTLVVFDMDGVLTQHHSSWQFVHDSMGVDNRINYTLFKDRKLSYEDFLESDVKLWKEKAGNLYKSDIVGLLYRIPLRDNLESAMSSLKAHDATLAIVSAGISWLADRINSIFMFDFTFSNALATDSDDHVLPFGNSKVDPLKKGQVVRGLQDALEIGPNRTVSVGDSKQDIQMFRNSGFSVGFNPMEEEVGEAASLELRSNDLQDLARVIIENCLTST